MGPINSTKKCSRAMNSNKNKLNSKISWLFKLEPNAHEIYLGNGIEYFLLNPNSGSSKSSCKPINEICRSVMFILSKDPLVHNSLLRKSPPKNHFYYITLINENWKIIFTQHTILSNNSVQHNHLLN